MDDLTVALANEDMETLATILHERNCTETHDEHGNGCTFPNQKSWGHGAKAQWRNLAVKFAAKAQENAKRLHGEECSENHEEDSLCLFHYQKSWAFGHKLHWLQKANNLR